MAYPFKREPRMPGNAGRLASAYRTPGERLVIWTLLDTGLRVSELCRLARESVLWQQGCLLLEGKGGPYAKKTAARVVPVSHRVTTLFEAYVAVHDSWPLGRRAVQKLVKDVASRAGIPKDVTVAEFHETTRSGAKRREPAWVCETSGAER